MKLIAELTMELECGGMVVTYLPCKSESHLLEKLTKRYKKGYVDFGHIRINDESVVRADYKLHKVH